MSEHSIDSLCEFLLHAGTDFRIFDLGRGVKPVSSQAFLEYENGLQPAPFPRQEHAWFAIVFWQASHAQALHADNQYIWFVKFALDEESKIISATRNHFLQLIVDALQKDPTLGEGLKDNPYVFIPSEVMRAQLTGMLRYSLNQIDDESAAAVLNYIKVPGAIDWRNISHQNVHDAVHQLLAQPTDVALMINNWEQLAPAFKDVLLLALEPLALPEQLASFLIDEITSNANNIPNLNYVQALAAPTPSIQVTAVLMNMLNRSDGISLDLLSLLAGRFAHQFSPAVLSLFFQRCIELDEAEDKNGELIKGFYADLVRIPAIRSNVLNLVRQ